MRNETGRLPAVHYGAVADRDAYGLSPLEINCRHFVAILGDKGCYMKWPGGTKVIDFRYELALMGGKTDAVGRFPANS